MVEHLELILSLRKSAESSIKEERARAIQAQRYARRRLEGLMKWNFSIQSVDRKDLIRRVVWGRATLTCYY